MLLEQHMDDLVLEHLKINAPKADMQEWRALVKRVQNLNKEVTIKMVGKYVQLPDAYLSVNEALKHAGYYESSVVHIEWVNAEEINQDNVKDILKNADGILIPGGFGERGIEGMIIAIQYAREHNVPFLGICLGMQLASIEFARHVCQLEDVNSMEFDQMCQTPLIHLMSDQSLEDMGGTQRLGDYTCQLIPETKAYQMYGKEIIHQV